MKKLIFILTFLFPVLTFANESIIWSKDMGNGVIWKQTLSSDIIEHNKKTIYSNYTRDDGIHMLCAYQGIYGSDIHFSLSEISKLKSIGAISTDGKYFPPNHDSLSKSEKNILYQITSRYCESDTIIDDKLGNRWIKIKVFGGQIIQYDTLLQKIITPFFYDRNLLKTDLGYFGIYSDTNGDHIGFLSLDGKKRILGLHAYEAKIAKEYTDNSLVIDNFSFTGQTITVDYSLIGSNMRFKKKYFIK